MLEYTRVELATVPVYSIDIKDLIEKFLMERKEGPIRKELCCYCKSSPTWKIIVSWE